jgi:hypothetical protein
MSVSPLSPLHMHTQTIACVYTYARTHRAVLSTNAGYTHAPCRHPAPTSTRTCEPAITAPRPFRFLSSYLMCVGLSLQLLPAVGFQAVGNPTVCERVSASHSPPALGSPRVNTARDMQAIMHKPSTARMASSLRRERVRNRLEALSISGTLGVNWCKIVLIS